MKRILVLFALFPFVAQAQDTAFSKKGLIKEVTVGVMIDFIATHNIGEKVPFAGQVTTVAPCIDFLTKYTDDHLMYGLNDNSIQTLNGILLPRYWDVYTFFSKCITKRDAYGSIGIEKILPASSHLACIFFAEIGTNFEGTASTSIGVVIQPTFSLLRKKSKG